MNPQPPLDPPLSVKYFYVASLLLYNGHHVAMLIFALYVDSFASGKHKPALHSRIQI